MPTLEQEKTIITKTSTITILLNMFLAVMKIFAGIVGHSTAIITDAVNSISDVLTNVIIWFTGKMSRKERDKDHPYGHEKYESMISLFIGVALIITVFEIGKDAILIIYNHFTLGTAITTPTWVALVAAFLTIAIKETMYRFTKIAAKASRSSALVAQAYDHRGDVITASGAIIGIGGSMLGLDVMEPIASLVICGFILRLAFKVIRSSVSQVVDQAADDEIVGAIRATAIAFPGVIRIDELRTRQFGMKLFVDLEIAVNAHCSLLEAHKIAERLHDEIEARFPDIKHCMIHVNPDHE